MTGPSNPEPELAVETPAGADFTQLPGYVTMSTVFRVSLPLAVLLWFLGVN